MKIIRDLITQLKEINNSIQELKNKEFEIKDKRFSDLWEWILSSSWGDLVAQSINSIIDKDYFTKEFLSEEQTDVVKIMIINWYSAEVVKCRECNLPEWVKNIWDKLYYFED